MSLVFALLVACSSTPTETAPVEAPASVEAPAPKPKAAPEPAGVVKLNADAASEADLMASVPGMTKKMAHEIEEYRPYKSVRRFQKEIGKYVNEATIATYLEHLYVPVDLNGSDAATLMQLPGLDEAEAKSLIAGRPYADGAAAKAALSKLVSDLNVAKAMVSAP